MIDEVVDTIGIQIYQYLHPKDLFFLSICNHKLYNDIVHKKLAEICISHLPLQLGAGTNYLGTFKEGASFGSKEELLKLLLDKTEVADILLENTTTTEESRRLAKEKILGGITYCLFYPRGVDNPTFATATCTTTECHYRWGVLDGVASSWVDQIINRSTFRKDKETHTLINSWLDFLLAIGGSDRRNESSVISFGMWSWSCKHPKLNGQGIAGTGVMIKIQQQNGEEGNSSKIVEISFKRSY